MNPASAIPKSLIAIIGGILLLAFIVVVGFFVLMQPRVVSPLPDDKGVRFIFASPAELVASPPPSPSGSPKASPKATATPKPAASAKASPKASAE